MMEGRFRLAPKQSEALRAWCSYDTNTLSVTNWGRREGKTFTAMLIAYIECLVNDTPVWVVHSHPMLYVFDQLDKVHNILLGSHIIVGRENKIRILNNKELIMRSNNNG